MKKIFHPKFLWALVGLVAVGGIWYIYALNHSTAAPSYTTAKVTRGNLVVSVMESGQVIPSNKTALQVSPQASGTVTTIPVKAGQQVNAGDTLATLDDTTAQANVVAAQNSLATAKNSLAQLIAPPTPYALTQAQDAVAQAQRALQTQEDSNHTQLQQDQDAVTQAQNAVTSAQNTLNQAQTTTGQNVSTYYTKSYTDVSGSFVNLSAALNDLTSFMGTSLQQNEWFTGYQTYLGQNNALLTDTQTTYTAAQAAYATAFNDLQTTSATSSQADITTLVNDTVNAAQAIAAALTDANNVTTQIINNPSPTTNFNYSRYVFASTLNTMHTALPSDISAVNGNISTLTTDQNNITSVGQTNTTTLQADESALAAAQQKLSEAQQTLSVLQNQTIPASIATLQETLTEKQQALTQLQQGPTQLQIQAQQIVVANTENNLQTAETNLSYDTITSPIAGIVSAVNIQLGQNVSSGTDSFDLISASNMAQLTVNEVDAAKIKTGDRATLTFDALPNVHENGTVTSVDTTGTVSQGVVTYSVYVSINGNDPQIKPGMSATANIITASANNVLLVPNAAISYTSSNSKTSTASSSATGFSTAARAQFLTHRAQQQATPSTSSATAASATTAATAPATIAQPAYVKILKSDNTATEQPVVIGLSNATMTEIISGLSEGDTVITGTQNAKASAGSSNSTSSAQSATNQRPGGTFIGGGNAAQVNQYRRATGGGVGFGG